MQVSNKVKLDLLFCFMLGFIVIQASNSASHNEVLTNSLSLESIRISEGF